MLREPGLLGNELLLHCALLWRQIADLDSRQLLHHRDHLALVATRAGIAHAALEIFDGRVLADYHELQWTVFPKRWQVVDRGGAT